MVFPKTFFAEIKWSFLLCTTGCADRICPFGLDVRKLGLAKEAILLLFHLVGHVQVEGAR